MAKRNSGSASAPRDDVLTPPYVPWPTFVGFIERLSKTAIPTQIDSSVMTGMSGSAQSALRSGMRFLQLIEGNGVVTQHLRDLVAAYGKPTWKDTLSDMLANAYAMFLGDVDLENATMQQLAERFRTAGRVDGSVLRKAIRFYLSGLDETGGGYSPFLANRGAVKSSTKRSPQGNGTKRRRKTTATMAGASATPTVPSGMRRLNLGIPGKQDGIIIVPESMSESEWALIDQYVRSYVKLQSSKK